MTEPPVPVEPTAARADDPPAAVSLPPPVPGAAVSAATQEIRIAATMTGGVSLAIWMGGVAREINLLDQASRMRELQTGPVVVGDPLDAAVRDVYRRLLDLLDVTVRVDVLSGTSAGGINAALLGLCHARGVDLGLLRGIWLDAGAFNRLLRSPAQSNPPSLLQGDGVLLATLDDGIRKLARQTPLPAGQPRSPRPTTVFITTTLLHGETSRFTDSYGTVVPDVDHHGLFRFDQGDLAGDGSGSVAQGEDALSAVALAARSSASFPGAFEPAFIPFDAPETGAAEGPATRPAMEPYANLTRSHWVADGGLLANRPIGPLLETIFERPADERQVRRVLLYVVPDPGGTASPTDSPPEESFSKPLSMGQALLKDLAATQSQSIAGDLAAIRRHNDRVDALGDVHLTLADLGLRLRARGDASRLATDAAWADYRAREGMAYVRPAVDQFHREVTTRPATDLPPAWRAAVQPGAPVPGGESLEALFRRSAAEAVSRAWQPPEGDPPWAALAGSGLPGYNGAKAIVLGLIRRAYAAGPDRGTRAALATMGVTVHNVVIPPEPVRTERIVTSVISDALAGGPATAADAAQEVGRRFDETRTHGLDFARAWRLLAQVLVDHAMLLRRLAGLPVPVGAVGSVPPPAARTQRQQVAADELGRLVRFLCGDAGTDPAGVVATRLLDLYVAARAILPVSAEINQPVELVQVSANTRTRLDPRRLVAADKLTGSQLHHFGAFYKASWRANDWMWGRLDGNGWLVHMLLDPRRLRTVAETVGFVAGPAPQGSAELLAALTDLAGPPPDEPGLRDAIDAELAFLDDPAAPLPPSLPNTALWVASFPQRFVAAAELPVIAQQMQPGGARTETGATLSAQDRQWLAAVTEWVRQVQGRTSDAPTVAHAGVEAAAGAAARAAAALVTEVSGGPPAMRERAAAAAEQVLHQVGGDAVAGIAPGIARAAASAAVDILVPLLGRRPSSDDVQRAAAASAAGASVALAVPAPAQLDGVGTLLRTCPVPDQKLGKQAGEPLFAQTVTKALAVATAAGGGGPHTPKPVRGVLSGARTVTMAGYRAVDVTGGGVRWRLAAGVALTALGAVLAFQHSTLWGLTGIAALLVGLYLLTLAAWGMGRRAVAGLVAATAVAAVVWVLTPTFRSWLVGDGHGSSPDGWVGRVLLPWIRTSWWSMLVIVGALVVAVLAIAWLSGMLQARARERERHRLERARATATGAAGRGPRGGGGAANGGAGAGSGAAARGGTGTPDSGIALVSEPRG